jgi:SAM-dependent methyltransferase
VGRTNELREGVRRAYSEAARHPRAEHPFPVGREFAESLGYPRSVLEGLPLAAVEAFSGVSNVGIFAALKPDATVLDLGCGAGLDSLIAAQRVGPGGRVVGIDFSTAMLERAKHAVRSAPVGNTALLRAAAEKLPLADATIDVALVNGIFNLNPARAEIFAELARVVSPGGAVFAAELILKEPLPSEVRQDEASWFS